MAIITRRTPQQGTQTNLFGQINFSFLNIATHSYYYLSRQQSTSSSASWQVVLAFIVLVFLTFLQIKYQGKDISPFDTYPKSLGVSIASLLLYCPACYAELKSSSCEDHRCFQTYTRHGTMVFGSLGLVSLVSILFPYSVGSLLYLLYILFFAGKFLPRQLLMLWNWLHQIVLSRVPVMLSSRLIIVHSFSNSRGNNLWRNILSV